MQHFARMNGWTQRMVFKDKSFLSLSVSHTRAKTQTHTLLWRENTCHYSPRGTESRGKRRLHLSQQTPGDSHTQTTVLLRGQGCQRVRVRRGVGSRKGGREREREREAVTSDGQSATNSLSWCVSHLMTEFVMESNTWEVESVWQIIRLLMILQSN